MLAKIERIASLLEGETYCALSLSGDGVPLAPHCVRQIMRAPHPMYPRTFDHKEDHVAMEGMLNDVCNRINSYDHLKVIEEELRKAVAWLSTVGLATSEYEYEKDQLLTHLNKVLSGSDLGNSE